MLWGWSGVVRREWMSPVLCPRCGFGKLPTAALCVRCLEPAATDPEPTDFQTRPVLVAILAVIAMVAGVAMIGMEIFNWSAMMRAADELRLKRAYLAFSISILAALTLASGIGMWRGTIWGWWSTLIFHV